jgi:hypothetical protein|tara:strand:- start:2061 stop:2603 length:543 start_codon:yes stop_codon:yes gene_type:complete
MTVYARLLAFISFATLFTQFAYREFVHKTPDFLSKQTFFIFTAWLAVTALSFAAVMVLKQKSIQDDTHQPIATTLKEAWQENTSILLIILGCVVSAVAGPFIHFSWMKSIASQVANSGTSDALGFTALLVGLFGWLVGGCIGGVIAMIGASKDRMAWGTFQLITLFAAAGSFLVWITDSA